MKCRSGFVSNSSSASFAISKSRLSEHQVDLIHDHIRHAQEHMSVSLDCVMRDEDAWSISEDDYSICGYATMDNFDMREFLSLIGVDADDIEWRYY